jgi:hypothetical protein
LPDARDLDGFEVDFVAAAPGHQQWIFAQAAAPAERLGRIEATGGEQAGDMILRKRTALDGKSGGTECGPCEKGGDTGGAEIVLPEANPANKNCGCGDNHQRAQRRGIKRRRADSGGERGHNPNGGKLHGRRRSRVTASM